MNLLVVEKILVTFSTYSAFLPIAAGIWAYKKSSSLQNKLLLYLIFVTIVDFYTAWLSRQHINNLPIFHLGTLIEYLFFAYLFYKIIESSIFRNIILVGTICFMVFNISWLYFIGDIFNFNHETRILESLLLVMCALYYFNDLSKDISTKTISFTNVPMFWVSLGILLYFTGNFFLFLFYRYIVEHVPEIWSVHAILNILTNILFTISFLCKAK